MDRIRLPLVVTSVAALICALAAPSRVARAEPPEPVIRTFGVLLPFWAVPSDIPDFLSEDSITITVLPDAAGAHGARIQFASNADCSSLPGTTWYQHPAHHASRGGSTEFGFFWLDTEETPDPPPVGAHTFTGADTPFVISMTVYQIKQCAAGDGCCGTAEVSAHYYRAIQSEEPLIGSDGYFVVVEAWFSR